MRGSGKSVGIDDSGYLGKSVEISPMNCLRTAKTTRLVGKAFSGAVLDPNFWQYLPALGGAGTVVQGLGQVTLRTNGVGTTNIQTMRSGRYVAGCANQFRTQLRHTLAPTAGNIRRWGPHNADNGAFFEFNGATVNVVTRRVGFADIPVAQTAWNGPYRLSYNPADLLIHAYAIYYTNVTVYFTIDEKLVHTVPATTLTWTGDTNLPCRFSNDSAGAVDASMEVRAGSVNRLGEPLTRPQYRHAAANSALIVVLKYGPGTLHGITLNTVGAANNIMTFYDNTVIAAPSVIAVVNTNNANLSQMNFGVSGLDFYTGLGYVLNGGLTAADVTILFE